MKEKGGINLLNRRPDAAALGCLVFLAMVGMIHLLPAIVPSLTGTFYIALNIVLTLTMLGLWAGAGAGACAGRREQLITGTSVLVLLLLLAAPGFTTHDSERYLWDGAVFISGFDPYITAPDSPEVQHLRALWPTPEEHAKYATLYPPVAIGLFGLAALFGPEHGEIAWKVFVTCAAIMTVLLSRQWLRNRKKSQNFALAALSPLLLLETGVGAHLDIFAVLCLISALILLDKAKMFAAGALIGLAATIKFLPVVLLWPIAFSLGFPKVKKELLSLVLGTVAVIVLVYGSALMVGLKPIGILPTFFEKWRSGSPVYLLAEVHLSGTWLAAFLGFVAITLAGMSAWIARRDLIMGMQCGLALPLVISPVVFPWYLMVLVPLIAARPTVTGILWLTTLPFIYEVLDNFNANGVWAPADWPVWLIGAGWLAGLLFDKLVADNRVFSSFRYVGTPPFLSHLRDRYRKPAAP